jgi:ATP-dependent helicase/DNAse subunit B
MRRLLRDQLAFVWSEGMGWREHRTAGLQLALSPADFGTLVHEVLARALAILDSGPGIAGARIEERQHAFLTTISEVDRRWTLERTIPPARLWQAILDMAMSLGMTALLVDEELLGKVDTWTEVGFGGTAHGDARMPPWTATDAVNLKATNLQLSGRIDRLDVAKSRNGFMVTDYKTATKVPPNRSILDGGRNVQPLLYVAAAQTHLPDAGRRVARVVYLHEGEVAPKMDGEALEQAITDLSTFAMNAEEMLRSGVTLPGPDAMDGEAAFRLALPADMQLYRRTKSAAFSMVQAKIAAGWRL